MEKYSFRHWRSNVSSEYLNPRAKLQFNNTLFEKTSNIINLSNHKTKGKFYG